MAHNAIGMRQLGMTIVETAVFIKQAHGRLSEDERSALVDYLATHPGAGVVMEGTGGVRKLRWAVQGRGKSGGVRVVYYHHNATIPLFLLSVFAKNEKANLSAAEKKEAQKLVKMLIETYLGQGGSHG
jgi:hypothetical protein